MYYLKKITLLIFLSFLIATSCSKEKIEDTDNNTQTSTEETQTVTFLYHGEEVSYGIVSFAGREWMDRNLGAQRVANSKNDEASFGDLFQWGREADGHQRRTATTTDSIETTMEQPGHERFIIAATTPYDWNQNTLWNTRWTDSSQLKTTEDPCPCGWRIPTKEEWEAALSFGEWNSLEDAFNSPLKLPAAGRRTHSGSFEYIGTQGYYWSSTHWGNTSSYALLLSASLSQMTGGGRAAGFAVRCIKE